MSARNVYIIEQIMPPPEGWHAVFAHRQKKDEGDVQEWIEVSQRPLVALALVREAVAEGFEPTEEELAEADMVVHGLVCDSGGWMALPHKAGGDFLGYGEPGQPMELSLPEVHNPDKLPISISTPEQARGYQRQWAAEIRTKHHVIRSPYSWAGGSDG